MAAANEPKVDENGFAALTRLRQRQRIAFAGCQHKIGGRGADGQQSLLLLMIFAFNLGKHFVGGRRAELPNARLAPLVQADERPCQADKEKRRIFSVHRGRLSGCGMEGGAHEPRSSSVGVNKRRGFSTASPRIR